MGWVHPGDVDDLETCHHDLAALAHLGEGIEAVVRHISHADFRLRRRERV